MVCKLGCTLESLREILKIPVNQLNQFLGEGPRPQHFLKLLRWICHIAKFENHWARQYALPIVSSTVKWDILSSFVIEEIVSERLMTSSLVSADPKHKPRSRTYFEILNSISSTSWWFMCRLFFLFNCKCILFSIPLYFSTCTTLMLSPGDYTLCI